MRVEPALGALGASCRAPTGDTPRHGPARRGGAEPFSLLLVVDDLPGILHGRLHRLELDVLELAADPADLAQVLVLDDVTRLRVDRDRPARAVVALVMPQQVHGPVRIDLPFL